MFRDPFELHGVEIYLHEIWVTYSLATSQEDEYYTYGYKKC